MASHVQVDVCPICSSPVYAKLVRTHEPIPDPEYTCRCRVVYPDRFKVAGQQGYGRLGIGGIRR
jgi:hypothetical protein